MVLLGSGAALIYNLVLHNYGPAQRTQYFIDFQEGPWGFLTWAEDPRFCIHPAGGAVDAGNGTQLVFHQGRHPGAYFAFNETERIILHIGGRYFHPNGGSSAPGDQTDVVLWDGFRDATRFFATDGIANQVQLQLPARADIDWICVFDREHAAADGTAEWTKTTGLVVENTRTVTTSLATKLSLEAKIPLLEKASLSAELTTTVSEADKRTWQENNAVKETISWKKGDSIARWQRRFNVKFGDNIGYHFYDATATYDTSSRKIPPPL